MAKFWTEPLDVSRHLDHFHAGGAVPREKLPRGGGLSFFVEVAGFTFEFASPDQIREALTFFEAPIHGSSRRPVSLHEKGEWQAWHERLPAHIRKGSKRARVVKALRNALDAFA